MKIAILNFEQPWHVLVSTSLIKGLIRSYKDSTIDLFIDHESLPIVQYNTKVNVFSGYIQNVDQSFDLAINMTPKIDACNFLANLPATSKKGFIEKNGDIKFIDKNAEEYYSILYQKDKSEKHIFQIIYKLCGLTWKGEGYDLAYFPKNKTSKRKTGVAIAHEGLRQFIRENLSLQMTEMCHVPMKKDLFKRMDEINRCMYILTDDLFTVHASIALRKNVEFLDIDGLNTKLEFFGKGNHYRISDGIWRFQMEKDRSEEDLRLA